MVLTSFKENCIIKIEPKEFKSRQRVLWLSFWAEVRYLKLILDCHLYLRKPL